MREHTKTHRTLLAHADVPSSCGIGISLLHATEVRARSAAHGVALVGHDVLMRLRELRVSSNPP